MYNDKDNYRYITMPIMIYNKEYNKKYYENNKDYYKEYLKQYRENNKEYITRIQ
jgi:hypothetical protein